MTHSDIYTKFMIEYDKAMITSSYPSLTKYEVAVLLDKAYLALIAQKVTGNNPRQAIFEADTKAIEDIRPLLVTDKHLVKSYEPKNGVTNGFTCELPKDMLYFVSATTQLYNVPAVEDRDYAKRRISNVVLVDHTTASKFFATDVNMPWIKTPVAYIEGDEITTIYDLYECMKHGHYPHELNVTYIKKPAKFALSASEQVLVEPQEPTNTKDLEPQGGTPVNPGDTPSNPGTPVNPSDPGNNDDPNGGNSGGGNNEGGNSGGGNSGGTTTTKTATFNFDNPTSLNPSITPSTDTGGGLVPVKGDGLNISFTTSDGKITVSFELDANNGNYPVYIKTIGSQYFLLLNTGTKMVITASLNTSIDSVKFGGSDDGGYVLITDVNDLSVSQFMELNDTQTYYEWYSPSNTTVTSVKIRQNSLPLALFGKLYVNYRTVDNSGGNSGGGNSVSTKTYTFKFNNPTKLIPSISENSINNTYPLDNTTFRSYDGKVSISFVNSTMGGGVGIAAMLSKSTTDDGTSFYFLEIPRGALMIVTGNGVNLKSITKSGDSLSGGLYVYEASGGTAGAFADWTAGSTNATVVKFINNGHNPKIYELDVTYSGSGLTTDPTDIPTNPTTPSQTDMEGFGSLDQYVYERYGNSISTSGYEYTNTRNRPIFQLDKLYYFINARNSNGSINENPMYLYCNNNIKIKIYLVTNSTGDAITHVVKAYGHLEYVSNFDKEEGFEGCGAVHLVWDTDLTQAITEKAQYLIEVPKGAYGDLNYKKYLLGDTTISKSSCHINGVNHDNCDWESFWVDPNLTSGNNSGDSEYTYNPNDPNDYPKGSDGYFLREYSIPSGADTKITLIYNVYWNMESSPVKDVWFNNIYMYCKNISLKPAGRPVEIYLWDEGGTASLRTPERKGTFETYQTPYGTLGLHVKWTRPINEENPIEDGTRYVIVIPEGSYCNTEGTHYNAYTYYYFEIDNENGIAITEPIYN